MDLTKYCIHLTFNHQKTNGYSDIFEYVYTSKTLHHLNNEKSVCAFNAKEFSASMDRLHKRVRSCGTHR